jgi:hypothetical protein
MFMWKMNRSFTLTGVLALALVLAGCAATSEAEQDSLTTKANDRGLLARIFGSSTPVTLPEGTVVAVTLDQAISSEDSRSGETFDATVSDPIVVDGKTVVPKGSRAIGRIVEAESSGRLHNPGRLVLDLASIEVGGTRYDIDTSNANRAGESHKRNNVIFIGGGTAAIIGGIIGGGKGAAIGAAAGAGGGTATAAATGKNEVHLPAETQLRFPLSEPVTIQIKN